MTVQELIDELKKLDMESRVVFVRIDKNHPDMDSYQIDEVKQRYGFVTLS